MQEELSRGYYAIIPASVRYDSRLPANAKLLYGEITALCNERGYCWAENKYFADLYGVSRTSVSKWVKALIDCGYIYSQIEYKEGSKEIDKRYLTIVKDPIEEKLKGYVTKVKYPIEEKLKDNNTELILQDNNTVNKKEKEKEKESVDYLAIVNAYKETCVSFPTLRNLSEARKKSIKARLRSGYTIDDFTTLFRKAQESDFLKGKNDRNWTATFDWLIKDSNMAKVLDGNYENKNSTKRSGETGDGYNIPGLIEL